MLPFPCQIIFHVGLGQHNVFDFLNIFGSFPAKLGLFRKFQSNLGHLTQILLLHVSQIDLLVEPVLQLGELLFVALRHLDLFLRELEVDLLKQEHLAVQVTALHS